MIKIDFFLVMALLISFSIFIVFIFWLFYNRRDTQNFDNAEWLKQCPYCTYVFFYYPSSEEKDGSAGTKLLKCPHCKSYIEIEKLN